MSSRPFVLLVLFSLLAACSSDAPKPIAPKAGVQAPVAGTVALAAPVDLGPLPVYQRELSGTLLGIPAGAQVELAVLVIDSQDRPQKLLASAKVTGNNRALPFRLRFAPEAFPAGARVELRGRASQSGILTLHLSPVRIEQPVTQALGQLQFVPAP